METFYSRFFGKNKKPQKKTQFKDSEVKEIVKSRRIFDQDLPGSNDNLRLSEIINNETKFDPSSNMNSSFTDVRNSKIDNDEPNEYRYNLTITILKQITIIALIIVMVAHYFQHQRKPISQ